VPGCLSPGWTGRQKLRPAGCKARYNTPMIDRESLTKRIRAEARRLGFHKMGITAAGPLPWAEELDDWLAHGMQGGMAYIERQAEKRKDPSRVLAGVRSIVTLAINYYCAVEEPRDPMRGRISRYAWGEDYHRLISGRLESLLAFVKTEAPGIHGLYYTDTGPVMEKVWGAHSSLGWLGKNGNLITREQGSWFFLGAILLDEELIYDPVERDHCGTCTRCIAACPTGAIVQPHVVDARRCISYLTIEWKGPIPRDLRPLIGNRIFGCDDCQEVCPWNRFAVETGEPGFRPFPGNAFPQLADLVDMTPEMFESRFRNSPIRRVTRDGFLRNVVVALGNSCRPEAVPALDRALHDSSPLVRGHAAWALGQIGSEEAIEVLRETRDPEPVAWVREEIDLALKKEKRGRTTIIIGNAHLMSCQQRNNRA
jgi:epoxyqueuosine reductase